MKNYILPIITVVLMFAHTLVLGQNTSTNFTANSYVLTTANQDVYTASTLTKSGNTFVWIQNNSENTVTYNFNVSTESGNWNKENSSGELIYTVSLDEETTGTITLIGSENNLLLTLSIQNVDGYNEAYDFKIDSITY